MTTTVTDRLVIAALADAIIDILEQTRGLDGVKLFIRGGTPVPVPQQLHPYCEVMIGDETPDAELTGGLYQQTYTGLLTFTCQTVGQGDWLEKISARRSRVRSYDLIGNLVTQAAIELQREMHHSLGDLAVTMEFDSRVMLSEVVEQFHLTGPLVYGLDDRTNNFENFGSIGFVIETQRTIYEGAAA
jgi:hypothetical protein